MEKRVTKKEYFEMLKEVVEIAEVDNKDELITFINNQVELLNRKKKSVNTKKQEEVEEKTERVFEALVSLGRPATATEIGNEIGVSNQQASAYLRKLILAGRVENKPVKKVSYFQIVEEN